MTESNPTQVILTDDGIKIIKAQNTADNAASGVTNLNDPNLMSVIEKQNNIGQFAGLTSQYNVLVQNAKDEGIDTVAVTTAYNNLNKFMADILADPDHASDIDRVRYKKYQDAYNEELAKLQNALQNNTNDKFTSAASALSQVASTANVAKSAADSTYAYANSEIAVQSTATAKAQSAADGAFSQAQVVGSQADSAIAVQSTATAKAQSAADNAFSQAQVVGSQASAEINSNSTATATAQSTADNAFSQATTAIDNGKVTSQAVTDLKDGSKLTIAELENGLATKVANSDYASYKEQTASQIGQLVTNGAFSAYQTQTADLIAQKVATKDFSAYQATTAKSIESKVESKDFNTYKTQTADAISSKVESSDFQTLQTQVNNSAVGTNLLTNTSDLSANWGFNGTVDTSQKPAVLHYPMNSLTSGNYVIAQQSLNDGLLQPSTTYTASFYAKGEGTFIFYCYPAVTNGGGDNHTNIKLTSDYKLYTITFTTAPDISGGENFLLRQDYSSSDPDQNTVEAYVYGFKLEKGSKATDWCPNPEDLATKSQITQLSGQIDQKVDSGDFSTYKTQTTGLIAEKVANSDFKTYQKQTADLISAKVETKDFSSYKDQTATAIDSMVKSKDFESYKTQTAGAIDSKVSNSNYTSDMKQMAGQIEDKVSNGTFTSYKTETANLIGSKVSNGDFNTYKTQTDSLISSKVETKDFSSYKDETAKAISSKVESSDFNTYKTQTADAILSKVSKKDANNVNLIPYSSKFSDSLEGWQLAGWGATDRQLLVVTHNFYQNGTGKLLQLHTAQNATSAAGSLRFSVLPNTKYTFQFKAFASSNVVGANVYFLSRAYGSTKDYDTVHGLFTSLVTSPTHIDQYTVTFTTGTNDNEGYIRVDNIGSNNGASSGLFFTELKMELGDTATEYIYGGQDSMISQMSDDINLRVTKDDLVDQINLQAGKTLISSSGQLTLSGKNIYFDSTNPVIIPSANIDTALVGKKLTAADIAANTFTTNNGTFTVEQDGSVTAKNMTLNGGKLYSPTINASTINSSTINGTTFNGGDRINNANNTAGYYPMNITSDGTYKSTYFDSAVGLQSSVESGAISYKYRSMIGNGQYSAYDSVINGQGFQSQSGYTSAKDTTFSSPETITGYVNVTPATGIYLYGPTQQINFAGRSDNIGSNGITMDAYGNIYGQSNSSWWRIGDVNGNQIINFGIDKAGSNHIEFKRDIEIGNIGINMAHSIISQDGKGLYINSGKGGRADLNVASLNYTGSVSKSLLSEKKDVKKVDTSYWAQLVNSIDLATYQYKDDDNTSNLRLSGIVDDVNEDKQWNLPDIFVARDEDGKLAGIENIVLQNAMLATIQEQQKEIDKLNGHLLELEAKLNG